MHATLHIIGTGPGDPELLTIKAVNTLRACPAIAAPKASHGGSSTALAIVGHEPGIGTTAARLVGARGTFEFKKGAVCRVDVGGLPPAGPGRLVWFASPKMLVGLKG
jgi:phosphohistidine phosphatase SixA